MDYNIRTRHAAGKMRRAPLRLIVAVGITSALAFSLTTQNARASESESFAPAKVSVAQTATVVQASTTVGDVKLKPPVVSWDNAAHMHKITAEFYWYNWRRTELPWYRYKNIGGVDSFGVALSRGVTAIRGQLTLRGASANGAHMPSTWRTSAWTSPLNAYGGVISFQDKGSFVPNWRHPSQSKGNLNSASGTFTLWVKFPYRACYQVRSSYIHTWDRTQITSADVGVSGSTPVVNAHVIRGGSKWQVYSNPGGINC